LRISLKEGIGGEREGDFMDNFNKDLMGLAVSFKSSLESDANAHELADVN